jgi:NADPH:quinone reductase-like Zn-dependent oxidoreductase
MKAIVQDVYGSADVLEFGDVPQPSVGDGEVLIEVVAAGVDRGAWHFMTGQPYLMRILGFGVRSPKCRVPGTNVAGRIAAVGNNVTAFQPSDEVYGTCRGAWAEYARADADKIAAKPTNLSFEHAAVVPYGGFAGWQAVHDHGHVAAGQRVLVIGATGAVGSFAVQFAKNAGADVSGVCGSRSIEYARSLGIDHVIDYNSGDFADGSRTYDLIVDVFGRTPVSRLRRALTPQGQLVIAGGEGDRWIGGIQRQLWASVLSPFVPQHLGAFVVKEHARYLREMNHLLEAGLVAPRLQRTYPLIEAAEAVRELEHGQGVGRICLVI